MGIEEKKQTNKCRSESLYCTPKTNIILEFNYTSIKKKKKNYLSKHAYAHKNFCADTHITVLLYVMSCIEGALGTVESGGTECSED